MDKNDVINELYLLLGENKSRKLIRKVSSQTLEIEKARIIFNYVSKSKKDREIKTIIRTLNWFSIPKILATKILSDEIGIKKQDCLMRVTKFYKSFHCESGILKTNSSQVIDSLESLLKNPLIIQKRDFLWSGIGSQNFGFIFGPAKSGKTILAENLAIKLLSGESAFLGINIPKCVDKIFFISAEEDLSSRMTRIKKQIEWLKLSTKGQKKVYSGFFQSKDVLPRLIVTEKDWEPIIKRIYSIRPDIVFVDSLTRLYSGAIEDSSKAKEVGLFLRNLAERLEITLIVIHHTPKIGENPITMDVMAGSRVLAQEADFMIGVRNTGNGMRYMKEVEFRYKPTSEKVFGFKINDKTAIEYHDKFHESELLKSSDGRYDSSNTDAAYNKIAKLASIKIEGIVSTNELISELVETGVMSKQTLHSQLKKLINTDKLLKIAKGCYKLNKPF